MKYFQEKHLRSLTTCLYFVCVFVTRGKGECPRPQGQNNMVLTNEALLMNDFPEGSTATFECSNGYVIEQGSGVVHCTSGAWSEPQMTCQKKDCGTPRRIPHMNYDESEGTLFGAKVRMYCDEGFLLEGTSYRHCYATGWSGRAKCEEVTCDHPTEIKNGQIVSSHTGEVKYLAVVEYSCDEGYTLVGNNSIFCNGDGEFSRLPPECKVKTCPTPDIPFSISTQDAPVFLYKDTMSVTCEDGFSLQGPARLQCEHHGWSSPPPQCIREPSSVGTTEAGTRTNSNSPSEKYSKAPTRPAPTWIQEPTSIGTTDAGSSTNSKSPSEKSSKAPTRPAPTWIRGKHENIEKDEQEDMPARNSGYTVVIMSVISTVIIVVILLYVLHRFIKRKGTPVGAVGQPVPAYLRGGGGGQVIQSL
ncbi:complement decay-accelerating factor transmembrane isoform-like isoform X2 [Hypomesus transpacificus]|uniref:complement decay-accelerating factor transmembrane isoform-like isoform X2 n=1 Tax=Hypomesus transpacificus TaxID=137520 RepID=UPI001F078112|nr:complement decay-accelerating factor transmembrane isoform-like isoform X2 [Hypomesus transpacificus]